jgi:hypothetical protein
MIGYQLGSIEQEKVIQQIIQAYDKQIQNGWHPRFVLIPPSSEMEPDRLRKSTGPVETGISSV